MKYSPATVHFNIIHVLEFWNIRQAHRHIEVSEQLSWRRFLDAVSFYVISASEGRPSGSSVPFMQKRWYPALKQYKVQFSLAGFLLFQMSF